MHDSIPRKERLLIIILRTSTFLSFYRLRLYRLSFVRPTEGTVDTTRAVSMSKNGRIGRRPRACVIQNLAACLQFRTTTNHKEKHAGQEIKIRRIHALLTHLVPIMKKED